MCNGKATILHNTFTIIAANEAACAMFRCEEADLLDLDLVEIITDESLQGLAALRLKTMRELRDLGDQDLPLWRPDGTKFWVNIKTRRLEEKLYQSELKYKYEIPT
jgi:PAS domain-containing protein